MTKVIRCGIQSSRVKFVRKRVGWVQDERRQDSLQHWDFFLYIFAKKTLHNLKKNCRENHTTKSAHISNREITNRPQIASYNGICGTVFARKAGKLHQSVMLYQVVGSKIALICYRSGKQNKNTARFTCACS